MIMRNPFRDSLNAGKPTIGTHFLFSDPDIAELIGDIGLFDYAEFAAEYSCLDMRLMYHLTRAAQCAKLPLMIKLDQEGQGFWAQAAIGAGFKSILFTDIRKSEDVDECHAVITADTPSDSGRMGVKIRRPALSGYAPDHYLKDLKSLVFCIMIEKKEAVENLEAILQRAKIKGVDMVQWGPADYSVSKGDPNLFYGKTILKTEEMVILKCLEYGIAPRIEIAEVDQAKRYIDLGVRHFCIGWDRFILQAGLTKVGEGLRKLTEAI